MGIHSFFQAIFPTQRWNLGLLHCRQILYHMSHQGLFRVKVTFVIQVKYKPLKIVYQLKAYIPKSFKTKLFSIENIQNSVFYNKLYL